MRPLMHWLVSGKQRWSVCADAGEATGTPHTVMNARPITAHAIHRICTLMYQLRLQTAPDVGEMLGCDGGHCYLHNASPRSSRGRTSINSPATVGWGSWRSVASFQPLASIRLLAVPFSAYTLPSLARKTTSLRPVHHSSTHATDNGHLSPRSSFVM